MTCDSTTGRGCQPTSTRTARSSPHRLRPPHHYSSPSTTRPRSAAWDVMRLALQTWLAHAVPPSRLTTCSNPNDPAPSLPYPLRYAGGSQLLRTSPPASPHRYSAPCGFRRLGPSLSPVTNRTVSGHAFTRSVREPGPGSCCLYAGHHLGSKRISPRLLPRLTSGLGSDVT